MLECPRLCIVRCTAWFCGQPLSSCTPALQLRAPLSFRFSPPPALHTHSQVQRPPQSHPCIVRCTSHDLDPAPGPAQRSTHPRSSLFRVSGAACFGPKSSSGFCLYPFSCHTLDHTLVSTYNLRPLYPIWTPSLHRAECLVIDYPSWVLCFS